MAILSKFLGTATEKFTDVVDTLNDMKDKITKLRTDLDTLMSSGGVTPTPTPSPTPTPTPTPTPSPSGTVVYPTGTQSGSTGDTGRVEVGSANQRIQHTYKNGVVAGVYMFGLDADGNGVALVQQSDKIYNIRTVAAYSVGDPLNPNQGNTLGGSDLSILIPDDALFAVQVVDGRMAVLIDEANVNFGGSVTYNVAAYIKGSGARYKKWAGTTLTNAKIIAK